MTSPTRERIDAALAHARRYLWHHQRPGDKKGMSTHSVGTVYPEDMARFDAAVSAIDSLIADAERYRWLHSQCDGGPPWAETDNAWFDGEELDAAIDAARSERDAAKGERG
jgi:hypothetical protein